MNHIYFGNLRTHIPDTDSFIAGLISELEMEDSIWEPKGKTTRKGFQTEGNIFRRTEEHIRSLQSIIVKELNLFRMKFGGNEECDLIHLWPEEIAVSGWYVKMAKGGHQDFHLHPTGWVSGVVYLKTIDDPSQNEGALELSAEGYVQSSADHDYVGHLHQPHCGDIVLFPSSMVHRTIPVQKDVERCVVAFDMHPPTQQRKL